MALPASGEISLKQVLDEAIKGGFPTAGIGDIIGPSFKFGTDYADREQWIEDLANWPGWDSAPNLTPAEPHDIEEFYSAGVLDAIEQVGTSDFDFNSLAASDISQVWDSAIYLKADGQEFSVIGWYERDTNQIYVRSYITSDEGIISNWGFEKTVSTDPDTTRVRMNLISFVHPAGPDVFLCMTTERIFDDPGSHTTITYHACSVDNGGDITIEHSTSHSGDDNEGFPVAYLRREYYVNGSTDTWEFVSITRDDAGSGRHKYRLYSITDLSGTWAITLESTSLRAPDSEPYAFSIPHCWIPTPEAQPWKAGRGIETGANAAEDPKVVVLSALTSADSGQTIILTEDDSQDIESGLHYFLPFSAAHAPTSSHVVMVGHDIDPIGGASTIGTKIVLATDTGNITNGIFDYHDEVDISTANVSFNRVLIHYLEATGISSFFLVLYNFAGSEETLHAQLLKETSDNIYLLGDPFTVASDLNASILNFSSFVFPGQAIGHQRVYIAYTRDDDNGIFLCLKISANLEDL